MSGYRNELRRTYSKFDKVGFYELLASEKNANFLFANFSRYNANITWRVAHFLDDKKLERKQTFASFRNYMATTGVDVVVGEKTVSGKKVPTLIYTDTDHIGIALDESQISEKIGYRFLNQKLEGGIPTEVDTGKISRLVRVPTVEDKSRPSWFYNADSRERAYTNKVIDAAVSDKGIYGVFKPNGLSAMDDPYKNLMGMQVVAWNNSNGSWGKAPYSKVYSVKDRELGTLTRKNNSEDSQMYFSSIGARNLEKFVESTYEDGMFTIHAKGVFADSDFKGPRRKISRAANFQVQGDNGYLQHLPYDLKESFAKAMPHRKNEMNTAVFTTYEFSSIIPQQRHVFGVDIDKLDVPQNIDILKDKEAWASHIRNKMPKSMQKCEMYVMLSSSYGMNSVKNSEGITEYKYTGVSNPLSCRLWIRSDRPMDSKEFSNLLIPHHGDGLAADKMLYEHMQPIYGPPQFKGTKDPLEGVRYLKIEGERTFSKAELQQEIAALNKEKGLDQSSSYTTGSEKPLVKIEVNEHDDLITQARTRTEAKLTAIGDKEMLKKYTGYDNHFGALRNIANAHLNAVYDEFPKQDPLKPSDFFTNERKDTLAEEVRFLSQKMHQGFVEAHNDKNKPDADFELLKKYGIGPDAIQANGKAYKAIFDANKAIARDRVVEYNNVVNQIVAAAEKNKPLSKDIYEEYIDKYTAPTVVATSGGGIRADVFNNFRVLTAPNGIYLDNPQLKSENIRFATFDGSNKFYWHPQITETTPKQWVEVSKDRMYDKLLESYRDRAKPMNFVVCKGCDFNDIKSKLPVTKPEINVPRFAPRTRIQSSGGGISL